MQRCIVHLNLAIDCINMHINAGNLQPGSVLKVNYQIYDNLPLKWFRYGFGDFLPHSILKQSS